MTLLPDNPCSAEIDAVFSDCRLDGYDRDIPKAKAALNQIVRKAEARGRVDTISAMKDWADGIEIRYNKFFEAELFKVKQLQQPDDTTKDLKQGGNRWVK